MKPSFFLDHPSGSLYHYHTMKKQTSLGHSVIHHFETDDTERKIRIIAGAAILLDAAIILIETNGALVSPKPKTASDFIFLALLVIQFIFPERCVLLGLVTISAGLINIYYKGHLLGLLLYAFGFALFMKEGFFRTDKRVKIPLMFAVFLLVLATQLRADISKLIISLVNIVMGALIIWGFIFMFHDNLKEFYSKKMPLDLDAYGLTPRQIACVRGCRNKKSTKDIADEAGVSELVIKDEFLALYDIMDVLDRHDLYRLLEGREIISGTKKA